jgi:hypothetical protein
MLQLVVFCRPSFAAPTPFSKFIGLSDFSNFTRSPASNALAVCLAAEIKSGMPWNQLIVSWNADAPPGTGLIVEAAARTASHLTKFYTLARWSPDALRFPRTSVRGQQDPDGTVATDTLILTHPADAVQIRVTFDAAGAATPSLKYLGLSFANTYAPPAAHPPNRAAWGQVIATPERSQQGYPGAKGWCSPAALDMVLARWAQVLHRPDLDLPVPRVAAAVYDQGYAGTGNWPFNTALAGSFYGLKSCVTRLDDLSEVEEWIAAGIPVILSARWDQLLPGRPPDSAGHLIVCIGFTDHGDVVANDPSARLERGETVRQIYRRESVLRAWASSHHTVYLVYPETAPIPSPRYAHW